MKSEEEIRKVLEQIRDCSNVENCEKCIATGVCGKNKTGILKWVLE